MQFVSKVVLTLAVISNTVFAVALPQVLPAEGEPTPAPESGSSEFPKGIFE